ncbi:GspH/FimT family pseudopilin [Pseudomonas sp. BMS12]|uniref:GspH/FimT family pseudopilin n=1 Tax=Pseudomonas sp. BMS12 TaxID=1796033 RepID=UPI0009EEE835|nr:GspH/FimT family pseudopilin [Pseudomonas sp. BMS12]
MRKSNQCAFSLSELLLTLAIIAIGTSIAIPALGTVVDKSHQNSLRDTLHASLQQARAHAILHRRKVEVCASRDGLNCHTDWSSGWMTRQSGDNQNPLQRFQQSQKSSLQWAGFDKTIRFHPNGTSPTSNGRFYLCYRGGVAWQLILNRQGRVRPGTQKENNNLAAKCTS